MRGSSRHRPALLPTALGRAPDWRTALFLAMAAAAFLLGGASRAGELAQPLLRGISFAVLIVVALAARLDWRGHRFVVLMLAAAVAVPLVQLVPLPPALWTALPGRAPFAAIGPWLGGQPWRPLSLVPDATVNALFSLVVPAAWIASWLALPPARRAIALPVVLAGIVLSGLVGLLQLVDVSFDNPFINEDPGIASGLLANRNHQAVLLAIGVLLVPAWLARPRRRPPAVLVAGAMLATWLALMILAAGSRAGLAFGAAALVAAGWAAFGLGEGGSGSGRARRGPRADRRLAIAVVAIAALLLAVIAYAAFSAQGRAVQRLTAADDVADLRFRALPTVLAMVRDYFPVGSGVGSFDPLFRMHEPLALLKPTYFNHAHDDVLEVVLTTGIAGAALIGAGIAWWLLRVRAWWRAGRPVGAAWAGGGMVLMILAASLVDYPARTPLFMALLAQAALWLRESSMSAGLMQEGTLGDAALRSAS